MADRGVIFQRSRTGGCRKNFTADMQNVVAFSIHALELIRHGGYWYARGALCQAVFISRAWCRRRRSADSYTMAKICLFEVKKAHTNLNNLMVLIDPRRCRVISSIPLTGWADKLCQTVRAHSWLPGWGLIANGKVNFCNWLTVRCERKANTGNS